MLPILLFLKSAAGRNAIVAVLITGLLATSCVQTARVKSLKADLKDAKALLYVPDSKPRVTWQATAERAAQDLGTCRGSNETLSGALDRQNAALEAQKADGLRRATELARALQAAKKQASAAQSAADRILAFRSDTSDQCAKLLEVDALVKGATQ